jgi:hypothetical protein
MEINKEGRELLKRLDFLIVESKKRTVAFQKLAKVKEEINEKIDSQIDELFKELEEIHKEGDEIYARLESMGIFKKTKSK